MKVLCVNRGNVGSSVMHTDRLQHGSIELVMVEYHGRIGEETFNNYLLFAYEGGETATTLKKLGWASDTEQWHGESFTRFPDLDKSKNTVRAKLENAFPDIEFEGWW
jgi:hypothetical protein